MSAAQRAIVQDESPTVRHGKETTSGPEYKEGPHWICDRTKSIQVKYAAEGIASEAGCPSRTLCEIFQQAVEKRGDKKALSVERAGLEPLAAGSRKAPPPLPLEDWEQQTYKQYYDNICVAGRAMMTLGLERYDGVNIYGFNSPEWLIGSMGGVFAGGIDAGKTTHKRQNQRSSFCANM